MVVNCKYEEYDVYIGRPSIFGNPFIIGRDGNREQVCIKYKYYLVNNPYLISLLPTLKNKRLGCYCAPLDCHGYVIEEVIKELGI